MKIDIVFQALNSRIEPPTANNVNGDFDLPFLLRLSECDFGIFSFLFLHRVIKQVSVWHRVEMCVEGRVLHSIFKNLANESQPDVVRILQEAALQSKRDIRIERKAIAVGSQPSEQDSREFRHAL